MEGEHYTLKCTSLQTCATHPQHLLVAGQSRAQTEEEPVVHDVQGRSSFTACEACQQGQHLEGNKTSGKYHSAACARYYP